VRGELVGERLELAGRPLGEQGRAALHVDWSGSELQADGSLLGLARISGAAPSTSSVPTSASSYGSTSSVPSPASRRRSRSKARPRSAAAPGALRISGR
jgi:hypothetical protein